MTMIIGAGSEIDPAALKLYTSGNRTRIDNERPEAELSYEGLHAALKLVISVSPRAECRSLTGMYNCVGMVFASRRTAIDPIHLAVILRDDGFRRITRDESVPGDVVIYRRESIAQHVGIIQRVDEGLGNRAIWVLSQWGSDGEYIHPLMPVPVAYGEPTDFWTERRLP
jgi:hypothetical protein